MKNIVSLLFLVFFLASCASKPKVVQIEQMPKQEEKTKEIKKETIVKNVEQKDEISVFEPNDIIEDDVEIIKEEKNTKIAFTYSSKIVGKYAKSSMNTMMAFLDYKKSNYHIKVFDSVNEDPLNIENTINKIKESGITKVIALYTPKAVKMIHDLDTSNLNIYIPNINKNELEKTNDNFIYGGISYNKQINLLLSYSNSKNTMFYQNSFLGKKLKSKYENIAKDVLLIKEIKKKKNYYKGLVKDYRLNSSTLFLNTDIVKTSILLSQLRAYDIKPKAILSTQKNYNPKLISLTQEKDRANFIVSNSIGKINEQLEELLKAYGSNASYNWVDYSTLVGINYFYDSNESQLVLNSIEENQVVYEPKLFKATMFGFSEIK